MNRKTVYIIFLALAILVLVALLWWWFLRREGNAVQTTGTFGTAQNAQQNNGTPGSGTTTTNIGTALSGQTTSGSASGIGSDQGQTTQTNIQLGNIGGIQNVDGGQPGNVPVGNVGPSFVVGTIGVPNVIWLSGPPATTTTQIVITTPPTPTPTATSTNRVVITTGPGTVFNPIGINPITSSNPTGNGGILPNIGVNAYGQQTSGSSSGLGSVAIAAGVGVVSCAIVPALQVAAQALGFTEGTGKGAAAQAAATGAAATAALSVSTIDIGLNTRVALGLPALSGQIGQVGGTQTSQQIVDQFMGCITRNVAKIMLQQITNSVVNWINSGFNGSPAFVQNPTKFLQRTADQIAGQYIQSSALSFLCSPFQLQVRIAIAQSYANREANACTLTQVSNNITNFMRGTFSTAGGWPAFLSFTSVPTNNPYGAFIYGSVGLATAASNAQGQVRTDLLQGGGFLSFQQKVAGSCVNTTSPPPPSLNKSVTPVSGPVNNPSNPAQQLYQVCDYVSTTPGSVIAGALGATEKSTLDQLTLAKSFDEIISALINQLMTRTLQGGLSNLSGQDGYASNFYTPDQMQAQNQQQALLTQMQSDTAVAAQYGSAQQGSIQDIENVQSQLNGVYNCWNNIAQASSTAITPTIKAQAVKNAGTASTTLNSLNATINGYNDRITKVNTAIVALQQLQSRLLSAGSASDVSAVQNDYNAARGAGQFPTQADVTNAQQSRATLQSQMATISQQASASLQQCNAIF